MKSLEELSKQCVAVCEVPLTAHERSIFSQVQRNLYDGRIIDSDKVDGIESDKNLTRLILLLAKVEDVKCLCEEVREEEIIVGDKSFVVKYQRAVVSELPERWQSAEFQEKHLKQSGSSIQQIRPVPVPQRRTNKTNLFVGDPFQKPAGPYGPMSGFYYNIPDTSYGSRLAQDSGGQMSQPEEMHGQAYSQRDASEYGEYKRAFNGAPCFEVQGRKSDQEDKHVYDEPDGNAGGQQETETNEKPRKILVSDLPSTANEEILVMFFENTKMSGGGSVVSVDHDEESASAVIEFEEPKVVENVLKKQPLKMLGRQISVDVFDPEPVSLCTVEVTVPHNLVCEELIELLHIYFEHKKSLGGEVKDVNFDRGVALVTFYSEEVARRVAQKSDHKINTKPISVKLHIPESRMQKLKFERGIETSSDEINDKPKGEENEPVVTVKVKGVKKLPSRDTLEYYFDNKRRSGGFDLQEIFSDEEDDDVLYVKYQSEEVAKAVAERSHQFEGVRLSVSLLTPPKPPPSYPDKILIQGLKPTTTEDSLFSFIEARSGYIPVPGSMTFHAEKEGVVMVTLDREPDFVKMEKMCEERLDGAKLKISKVPISNCIIVSDLAPDVTKDTVEFYFENTRKSNGGPITNVVMNDDDTCFVYFEDYKVASRVAQKSDHKINKKPISVKLHTPESKMRKPRLDRKDSERSADETNNKPDEEENEPVVTVKVKGVKELTSRDTLEYHFDNKRRSGGFDLQEIFSDEEDDDVLYVKYQNEEVARAVAEQSHQLEGVRPSVSLFTPPKPPPSYPDKILIKGLKPTTTEDGLFNFIEAKSGYIPIPGSMTFHAEQEGVVMVTLDREPDFEVFEKMCEKRLDDAKLKISKVPISNCIIVSDLPPDVSKDTIEFYFENTRKSNGGPITKVVMNEDNTCFVYFKDYQVVDRVLEQQHELSNQKLKVRRYQECLGRTEGENGERKLNIPDPFQVASIHTQKIKYLKISKANHNALEKQMEACHTRIVWSESLKNVTLQCTLTKEVKGCYKLVKTWREEAKRHFEDFLNTIEVYQLSVPQSIWQKVMDQLKKVSIINPEAVAILVNKNKGCVTVVGNKVHAGNLKHDIKIIIQKIMDE